MAQGIAGAGGRAFTSFKEFVRQDQRPLLLLWVCALAFFTGAWFLLRGMAALSPAWHLPLPYAADAASPLNLYALLLGVALLCATAGLSLRKGWAWLLLVLCMLLVLPLAVLAWWMTGALDWAGLFAALALALTTAHPAVRVFFLQEEPR